MPSAIAAPPAHSNTSPKHLGLLDVFAISSGAMISSGLFVLPGIAFAGAGPAVVLAYALAFVGIVPLMLAKSELATAMPRAGGGYFFVERSLGPLAGTVAGFANWLSIGLKTAFALVGLGALALLFNPDLGIWGIKLTSLAALVVFTVVNLFGASKSGSLQVLLVAGLLAIIVAFIGFGLPEVELEKFTDFMPFGFEATLAVAGMVFVSYGGLTKVTDVAGEVRNPARNLPLGMFLAAIIVSVLYVAAVFVTVGMLDGETLSGSLMPLYDAARAKLGGGFAIALEVAAFLAFATTANAGILSASRSPLAMSRDGLVPEGLSRTSKRFGTPHVSILLTSGFLAFAIVALSVEDLVKTASTMILCMFMLENASVLIMRYSGLSNYRPTFRMPGVPWLPALAIVLYLFLIFEMGTVPLLLTGGFVLIALIWYTVYVHRRIDRQSALVYLVRRAVSKDIARPELEDELKQITIERDSLTRDRFDEVVDRALVLDIAEKVSGKKLFEQLSDNLAAQLDVDRDTLLEGFLARERAASTVVEAGMAIPHVIVPGENLFELAIVRLRKGAEFSALNAPVKRVFALVGSEDQRSFHLRALMSIARIVSEPGFVERWEGAPEFEALRDLLHLSRRQRGA